MRFLAGLLGSVIRTGQLELVGPAGETSRFGDGTGPQLRVRVTDPSLDWKLLLDPELKVAEAYMDGRLRVERGRIHDLIQLFFRNRRDYDARPARRLHNAVARGVYRVMAHNSVLGARRNAAFHYDLGNDFYRLWLDRDMQYSCAYFEDGVQTLDEAQTAKKRHIAAKLALEPGMSVLDIGCGWGGMALYLALTSDVEVTGVTLSEQQLEVARARAAALGVGDRIRFELRDYREVEERFDRIVSVGMLEHVGRSDLETYFQCVRDRLKPRGVALVHSIGTMAPPAATASFLQKYIFPGGYLPSLSEAFSAVEHTGLWGLDCEILRKHYAETLAAWRANFERVRGRAVEMYDERFARMWEIYLSGCEASFRHGSTMVFQLQLARERDAMPLTRDYLAERKAALAAREGEAVPALFRSAEAALDAPARRAA
jgi:cyclopropane-fatty-acyl-phospholipid synthase